MAYYLQTLAGKPELYEAEVLVYKQLQPLLLLSYLERKGEQTRQHIANIFWSHLDKEKRLARLSEVLRLFSIEAPNAIIKVGEDRIFTQVKSDIAQLYYAIETEDYEVLSYIYQEHFLANIESNQRLNISESPELYDWLLAEREAVLDTYRNAVLKHGELRAAQGDYGQAGELALKSYNLRTDLSMLIASDYTRVHTLLLASDAAEASHIRHEGVRIFENSEDYCKSQAEARQNLEQGSTLPQMSTDLIGRQDELEELKVLLRGETRLVCLEGPPGIGKTHLAIEVARQLRGYRKFQDGVFFINLEQVTEPSVFVLAMMTALKLEPRQAGLDLESLMTHLKNKHVLLVLDNADDLSTKPKVFESLLETCSGLSLLLSSRLNLDSSWAQHFPLMELDYPQRQGSQLEDLDTYPATALLKKELIKQKLDLAQFDLKDLNDLLALTAGLPLAIKLAANWLGVISLKTLLAELKENLSLLESDSLQNHSLYAALTTSYKNLSPEEQKAFTHLAIFKGEFSLKAAQVIAQLSLKQLKALVQKSLLGSRLNQDRYYLHPLIRQFASEMLNPAELDVLKTNHADYYLKQLRLTTEGNQEEKNAIFQTFPHEFSNIEAAWQVFLEQERYEELSEASYALCIFCHGSSLINQGQILLDRLMVKLNDRPNLLAMPLAAESWFSYLMGDYESAKQKALKGLKVAKSLSVQKAQLICLDTLGACHGALGDYKASLAVFENLINLVKDDEGYTANTYFNLAISLKNLGQYQEAIKFLDKAIGIFQRQDKALKILQCKLSLATVLIRETKYEEALKGLAKLDQEASALKASFWLPRIQLLMSEAFAGLGKIAEAIKLVELAINSAKRLGRTSLCGEAYMQKGKCLLALEKYQDALSHLQLAHDVFGQQTNIRELLNVALIGAELHHKTGDAEKARHLLDIMSGYSERLEANSLQRFTTLAKDYYREPNVVAVIPLSEITNEIRRAL